jgi:predicted methyltransferase
MAYAWPGVLLLLLSLIAPGPVLSASGEKKGKTGPCAASAAAKPKVDPAAAKAAAEKTKKRAEAISRLAARLGLGKGGVVADIGAGNGPDTWVFAEIVGPTGKIYAEEITDKLVKSLQGEAEKRKLPQVRAVQGRDDDPALPRDTVDLAYMRFVYHHMPKPREMLRGIWRAIKPGGYFVVVDQHRGTLRDWVPREQRKDKHFWLAETTVVREAREEGFAFVACPEDCCDVPEPFVLVFQRPRDQKEPGRDPDFFLPLQIKDIAPQLLPLGDRYQHPVFVALGEARQLMRPILQRSSGKGVDVVLEEWATQKEERPPLPPVVSLPSVLTDQGDPRLGPEPISVVLFLDTYHLLFHGKTLLGKLRERLASDGCVYVLDREAKGPLSRREASHRRRIQPETVKQEMAAAGFFLWFEGPRPAADRFLLVFGKVQPGDLRPETDLFMGGPRISRPPEDWLKDNLWRLRGLRTANGKLVRLTRPAERTRIERVGEIASGGENWRLPLDRLLLSFQKAEGGFLLTETRTLEATD